MRGKQENEGMGEKENDIEECLCQRYMIFLEI
jgi:hypothetical protein